MDPFRDQRPYGGRRDELEELNENINMMVRRRKELLEAAKLDAKDQLLADYAYEAGVTRATHTALQQEIRHLKEKVSDRDSTISDLKEQVSDLTEERDDAIESRNKWRDDAGKLQNKLTRSERAKKAVANRKRKAARRTK